MGGPRRREAWEGERERETKRERERDRLTDGLSEGGREREGVRSSEGNVVMFAPAWSAPSYDSCGACGQA